LVGCRQSQLKHPEAVAKLWASFHRHLRSVEEEMVEESLAHITAVMTCTRGTSTRNRSGEAGAADRDVVAFNW